MSVTVESVVERIAAKTEWDQATGCLIWKAQTDIRGYGRLWFDGKKHQAHRVVFYLCHGYWPQLPMVVDHVCNRKGCVNPEHLRELTQSQNIMRCTPRADDGRERRREQWRLAQQRRRKTLAGLSVAGAFVDEAVGS